MFLTDEFKDCEGDGSGSDSNSGKDSGKIKAGLTNEQSENVVENQRVTTTMKNRRRKEWGMAS